MEVRYRNNVPSVVAVRYEPMPEGAIEWGKIVNPMSISTVLRRVVDGMGTSKTATAVIGIPASSCLLRNLMIPPVPAAELASVVAGEVEHYGIVRTQGGVHTFLPLNPPKSGAVAEAIPVAVLAVEEDVTHILREIAERAGIEVEALEPTLYAMFRAAMAASNTNSLLAIMIGTTCGDMAVMSEGNLIAYRRIETGAQSLIQMSNIIGSSPTLDRGAVEGLATETRRTMEYLRREYPSLPEISTLRVVVDNPALAPLAEQLSQRLGLTVEPVRPYLGPAADPIAVNSTQGPDGMRFAAVSGLGLHGAQKSLTKIPALDLYSAERSVSRLQTSKRNLAGSIAASLVAICLGTVGSFVYNGQINAVNKEIKLSEDRLANIKSEISLVQQQRALKDQQYKILRKNGVPIGPLSDALVGSLASGVGLRSFGITTDLSVAITGEATDEANMIKTVQALQKSPVLKGVMIQSFTRLGGGIEFQVSAKTVSTAQIKQPSDAPALTPGTSTNQATSEIDRLKSATAAMESGPTTDAGKVAAR